MQAGIALLLPPDLRAELDSEIAAQMRAFADTGLAAGPCQRPPQPPPAPDGIPARCWRRPSDRGVTGLRWTRDPFWLNARLSRGALGLPHQSRRDLQPARRLGATPTPCRAGSVTPAVFGLLQNARVDEAYVLRLAARACPPGDSELYSHPSLTELSRTNSRRSSARA